MPATRGKRRKIATIISSCLVFSLTVLLISLYEIQIRLVRRPNPFGNKRPCSAPKRNGTPPQYSTFYQLEKSLCSEHYPDWITEKSPCPKYGIITVQQAGRLGNQMWEYAAVRAISHLTGLQPYVPRCLQNSLERVFRTLSLPTLEEINHCVVDLPRVVDSLTQWTCPEQSVILPYYPFMTEWVLHALPEVIAEFTFKEALLRWSRSILREARIKTKVPGGIFVGVHVRRREYGSHLKSVFNASEATPLFYLKAMQYFNEKYGNVIFVVASDDLLWCNIIFADIPNVYITDENPPEVDLAVLASCNHSIFDYGTFGVWGALLSRGETVYFNNASEPIAAVIAGFLPNWHTV